MFVFEIKSVIEPKRSLSKRKIFGPKETSLFHIQNFFETKKKVLFCFRNLQNKSKSFWIK
jgi:hypothetical protein